jgi:drug/metabolite transporter (DMT)-like permease
VSKINPRLAAILQAFFVTFLWSTSWVIVKFGLKDIPAITFAGLRYFFAFLVLLPFYLRSPKATRLGELTRRDWFGLVVLGLVYYTLTQTSQFLGLSYLPAITFSLMLNFSAVVITLLGIPALKEFPTWLQWAGIGLFMMGVYLYFYPVNIPAAEVIGYVIAAVNVLATSVAAVLGRYVNREGRLHPLTVTVVSMGIGSVLMLAIALLVEGMPHLSVLSWGLIVWLAVINTAFAFTLWNHTLRTLSAMESGIINNTMLIQIAVLAWIFLDERVSWVEAAGMGIVVISVILVQWRPKAAQQSIAQE